MKSWYWLRYWFAVGVHFVVVGKHVAGVREVFNRWRFRLVGLTPVKCTRCSWKGMLRWTRHFIRPTGVEDFEHVNACPRCERELWWS